MSARSEDLIKRKRGSTERRVRRSKDSSAEAASSPGEQPSTSLSASPLRHPRPATDPIASTSASDETNAEDDDDGWPRFPHSPPAAPSTHRGQQGQSVRMVSHHGHLDRRPTDSEDENYSSSSSSESSFTLACFRWLDDSPPSPTPNCRPASPVKTEEEAEDEDSDVFWSEAEVAKALSALEQAHVNPNSCDTTGATPAHMAAKKGMVNDLLALLRMGALPNAQDQLGWTPLHFAARYDHVDCAKVLLARGALVNQRNSMGTTPLHVAAATCARETMRVLLAAGADNRAPDDKGETPRDVAHSQSVRRDRLVGRMSGRFLSKKGFGHWTFWRQLLTKEKKIKQMLDYVHGDW